MKHILIPFLLLLTLSMPLFAGDKAKVKDFTLEDYNGSAYTLSNYGESKAVVIMFISTRCPVSNAYNERMNEIYNLYANKGFTILAINSNKTETKKEVEKHTMEQGFQFPVLIDKNNLIADELGAKVTPEVFVVSPQLEILYHGRIDDSQNPENIKSHDLSNALTAILKGKTVPVQTTKAFGCSIKRIEITSN